MRAGGKQGKNGAPKGGKKNGGSIGWLGVCFPGILPGNCPFLDARSGESSGLNLKRFEA